MLRSVNDLKGFDIMATDGQIGTVDHFFFDDERWAVRYIIVNTGNWLTGQQVLVSPYSVTQIDFSDNKLYVNLTQEQVKNSPDIDTHLPVSRQYETTFSDYYGYPYYWTNSSLWGIVERPNLALGQSVSGTVIKNPTAGRPIPATSVPAETPVADSHLHSTADVHGYHIAATDGDIGHVEDFIVEDETWAIRYLVADTRNWWPGKKVLISPRWISVIDWAHSKVQVNMNREAVKESPEYTDSEHIAREYEDRLHRHYGQPGYWTN